MGLLKGVFQSFTKSSENNFKELSLVHLRAAYVCKMVNQYFSSNVIPKVHNILIEQEKITTELGEPEVFKISQAQGLEIVKAFGKMCYLVSLINKKTDITNTPEYSQRKAEEFSKWYDLCFDINRPNYFDYSHFKPNCLLESWFVRKLLNILGTSNTIVESHLLLIAMESLKKVNQIIEEAFSLSLEEMERLKKERVDYLQLKVKASKLEMSWEVAEILAKKLMR